MPSSRIFHAYEVGARRCTSRAHTSFLRVGYSYLEHIQMSAGISNRSASMCSLIYLFVVLFDLFI